MADNLPPPEDAANAEPVRNKTSQKPSPPKKKGNRLWHIMGVIGFIWFLQWGLSPKEGTVLYGICKTYIELNDPYPQNLQFLGAEELGEVVRINYRAVDPFGIEMLNYVECRFREDEQYGIALDSVDINREKKYPREDKERIERFNAGIPSLLQNRPDLAYPPGLPTSIRDYK